MLISLSLSLIFSVCVLYTQGVESKQWREVSVHVQEQTYNQLWQTPSFALISSAYPLCLSAPFSLSAVLRCPSLPIDSPVEYSWICPHGPEWLTVKMIVHFPLAINIKVDLALKLQANAFVMLPSSVDVIFHT